MPRGDVSNLVAEDTGHFMFIFSQNEKACGDKNVPPGNCKGVGRLFFDDEELKIEGSRTGVGDEGTAYAFDEPLQDEVIHDLRFPLDVKKDLFPEFPLFLGRQSPGGSRKNPGEDQEADAEEGQHKKRSS